MLTQMKCMDLETKKLLAFTITLKMLFKDKFYLTVASTFYSVTVASTFAPAGARYFGRILVHFLFKLFVF